MRGVKFKKITVICLECKQEFTASRAGHGYCGDVCYRKAYRRTNKYILADKRNAKYRDNLPLVQPVKCEYSKCQNEFTPIRSTHTHCSRLCGQRDREFKNRDRQREKRAEAWRKKRANVLELKEIL